MSWFYITLEGADDAAFTVNVRTVTIAITGALPTKVREGKVRAKQGGKRNNVWEWRRRIAIVGAPPTVEQSALDYGDLAAAEDVCLSKYLRIKADSTVLPRTMTTGGTDHNFWTDGTNGLLATDYNCTCTSFDVQANHPGGNNPFSFVLEGERRNV